MSALALEKLLALLPDKNYMLAPAYDLLSTALAMPADDEELALTLNGKKKRIKREDFEKAMRESGLDKKVVDRMFNKFSIAMPKWHAMIEQSFLPAESRQSLREYIDRMAGRLSI